MKKKNATATAITLGLGWGQIIVAGVCIACREAALQSYAGAILAAGAILVAISTILGLGDDNG